MKRYIKSASFYGMKYNYGVFMLSSSGSMIKLGGSMIKLGGSKTEEGANEIACNQAKSIAENPWTSAREKVLKISSIEVVDMATNDSAMFADTEDYLGDLISDINDSKK